jgi:SAM-dependent methyltransferase
MTELPACPICHSDQTRFLFEGWDLVLGYPDSALVYQCRKCDDVFVAGKLTPDQLTDMYTNYYVRAVFNVDDYKPYKEKSGFLYWLDGEEGHAYRHVPRSPSSQFAPPPSNHFNTNVENLRVLDIGCGYCESLGYHKARGCEVYGVEADENARRIAERFGFNVEIGLFDPKKYEPNSFDYVTMDGVFEHLVDPLKTLQEINGVLKPGGKFIATMPNPFALGRYFFGRYWLLWHLPFHRHFYSRRAIEILAEKAEYEVEVMKSATDSSWLLNNWMWVLFGAGKKGRQAPGATTWLGPLGSDVKTRWDVNLVLTLQKMRFLRLPMRLADFFGIGDNNLIILKKK